MKKYSLHQKPDDGEERKLNKPVICYPNHTLKVKYWENYQKARNDLEKIDVKITRRNFIQGKLEHYMERTFH